MRIFNSINEWKNFRKSLTSNLGFVPTMGNLHIGHLSLLQHSQKNNLQTLVSIFVNPTQFNNYEDFTKYPHTLEKDLQLLQDNNIDYCLLPQTSEIYADDYCYQIQENKLATIMEGKFRPGHFQGMLTVVMKLFNLVQPQQVYFGEKDYQQYLLILNMIESFFLNIKINLCVTIRENSGLAYSSRNNLLSKNERELAEKFAQIFHKKQSITKTISQLNKYNIIVEYIEDYANRRFAAVKIGNIRLIDNYAI